MGRSETVPAGTGELPDYGKSERRCVAVHGFVNVHDVGQRLHPLRGLSRHRQ